MRSALREAARKEFVRHGLQKARIEDITHACGVSKGAFYLHFESKEALFGELVEEFDRTMTALLNQREAAQNAFFAEHGPLTRRTGKQRAALLARFEAQERAADRQTLEALWAQQDLFDVLLHGVQGTPFEGLSWRLIDREVERVVRSIDQLKAAGACRREIPSKVIASMIIGSWLLAVRQLALTRQKPDFEAWLDALDVLIHAGISPRPPAAPRARAVRTKARSRSRS
jgi:AcrR family transcriptional regulator